MSQQDIVDAVIFVLDHGRDIAAYVSLSAAGVITLQYMKRKYKLDLIPVKRIAYIIRIDGPRIVQLLYTVFAGLATWYTWILDPNNAQFIPARFAFFITAGMYIHRFIVSPAGKRLETALQPYIQALNIVRQQQATAAQVPEAQAKP